MSNLTWEELITRFEKLADDGDKKIWQQSDLAKYIETRYGEDRMGAFAYAVNMSTQSMRQRARVGRFYPPATRVSFREDGLRWSHFRAAARLDTLTEALKALDHCLDQGMRCEAFDRYVQRRRVELGLSGNPGQVTLDLPFPDVSLNARFCVKSGRIALTEEAKAIKTHFMLKARTEYNRLYSRPLINCPVDVWVHLFCGDAQTMDTDNMVKLLLDGLNGEVWTDDKLMRDLHIIPRPGHPKRAEVTVKPLATAGAVVGVAA